jgi:hypothetical protein
MIYSEDGGHERTDVMISEPFPLFVQHLLMPQNVVHC